MDGYGYNNDLPQALQDEIKDVYIFCGNQVPDNTPNGGLGVWAPLKAGFGTGFNSNGVTNTYSDRFGPELAFGARIKALFPDQKIAIIKYSRGGTSIAAGASGYGCWEPDFEVGEGLNQYDSYFTTLRSAFADEDINKDGRRDVLIPFGIAWMQGEADANHTMASAQAYETNLKRLMDLFRASLREDDLPVVIGQIADSGMDETDDKMMDHLEIVQQAQLNFTIKDRAAALVKNTENYEFLSDRWHYKSKNYIDLGQAFAEELAKLIRRTSE